MIVAEVTRRKCPHVYCPILDKKVSNFVLFFSSPHGGLDLPEGPSPAGRGAGGVRVPVDRGVAGKQVQVDDRGEGGGPGHRQGKKGET